ncbi:MAG: phosphate ABC transporter permease PstA [Candidatus Njordarchaeota archaeon]
MKGKKARKDKIAFCILLSLTLVSLSPLILIIVKLLEVGARYLSVELFVEYPKNLGKQGGILNSILGSLILMVVSVTFSLPICLGTAIYLTEFVKNRKIRDMIDFLIDVLAGVPSIVFGIFGYYLFVYIIGLGFSLLSATLTLSLMMIPIMLRTIEETLKLIPKDIKLSSYALGASEWETTWNITIRMAAPGIVTGCLLAIGRILGETAPLILTTGYNFGVPQSFFEGVATMTFTIYQYIELGAAYPELLGKAAATGLFLIVLILVIDFLTLYISKKLSKMPLI